MRTHWALEFAEPDGRQCLEMLLCCGSMEIQALTTIAGSVVLESEALVLIQLDRFLMHVEWEESHLET